jgi:hypothetical protein
MRAQGNEHERHADEHREEEAPTRLEHLGPVRAQVTARSIAPKPGTTIQPNANTPRAPGARTPPHRATVARAGAGVSRRDRCDHVDPRAGLERRLEAGPLAVDVDVDVRPERRPGLAQAVPGDPASSSTAR